jgi:hypothetical protein
MNNSSRWSLFLRNWLVVILKMKCKKKIYCLVYRELRVLPDPNPDPTGSGSKDFAFIGFGSGSGSNFNLRPGFDFGSNPSIDELKVKYKIFFPLFQDCFVLFNLIIKEVISNTQTKKNNEKRIINPLIAYFRYNYKYYMFFYKQNKMIVTNK